MKKLLSLFVALFAFAVVKANDGAFYSQGNQLIPITESTIKVQKEILTITRIPDNISGYGSLFQVHVYYEFFNPGEAKDMIVGFESPTPSGNATEGTLEEAYQGQAFIYDFRVRMNDEDLSYQLAHVPYRYEGDFQFDYTIRPQDYFKDGRVQDVTTEQYRAAMSRIYKDEEEYIDIDGYLFYYVYYFNAHFNEGLNIIDHTYTFKGSVNVMTNYMFDYILTAANRWANNGIDDFTLEINMGDCESFCVQPTFFQNADEWTFSGKGITSKRWERAMLCEDCPEFHVQSGSAVFHKENFHPEGELHIERERFYLYDWDYDNGTPEACNAILEGLKSQYYNLDVEENTFTEDKASFSDEQRRIMKYLPLAYRGYVFKSPSLRRYFESTVWYMPNPDYVADLTVMSENEKNWIRFWAE